MELLSEIAFRCVSNITGHSIEVIKKPNRERDSVECRRFYTCLMTYKGASRNSISNALDKDHATVIHYIRSTRELVVSDKPFQRMYNRIMNEFLIMGRKSRDDLDKLLDEFDKENTAIQKAIDSYINDPMLFREDDEYILMTRLSRVLAEDDPLNLPLQRRIHLLEKRAELELQAHG